MEIYALFMLLGLFCSFLIPETKRKTLEQLAGEVPGTPEYDPRNLRDVPAGKRSDSEERRGESFGDVEKAV